VPQKNKKKPFEVR